MWLFLYHNFRKRDSIGPLIYYKGGAMSEKIFKKDKSFMESKSMRAENGNKFELHDGTGGTVQTGKD